jgi:hypothetical protein
VLRPLVYAIDLLAFASLPAQQRSPRLAVVDSIPADSVCAHARGFRGPCITVHGRVQTYSDNVIVGVTNLRTGHAYYIQFGQRDFPVVCTLPTAIYDLLASAKIVYADFVIRPLAPDSAGVMGVACIASATHVIARPGGLDHPLFPPRSP